MVDARARREHAGGRTGYPLRVRRPSFAKSRGDNFRKLRQRGIASASLVHQNAARFGFSRCACVAIQDLFEIRPPYPQFSDCSIKPLPNIRISIENFFLGKARILESRCNLVLLDTI